MSERVVVCGGRGYDDVRMVFAVLDRINDSFGIEVLAHGNAKGADTLADLWAESRQIKCRKFAAAWDRLGKAAGPERNRTMLHMIEPTMVIAFPGGLGTANMCRLARESELDIRVFLVPPIDDLIDNWLRSTI